MGCFQVSHLSPPVRSRRATGPHCAACARQTRRLWCCSRSMLLRRRIPRRSWMVSSSASRATPTVRHSLPCPCHRAAAAGSMRGGEAAAPTLSRARRLSVGLRPTACELTQMRAHCSGQEQGASGNRAGGARGRGGRGERFQRESDDPRPQERAHFRVRSCAKDHGPQGWLGISMACLPLRCLCEFDLGVCVPTTLQSDALLPVCDER